MAYRCSVVISKPVLLLQKTAKYNFSGRILKSLVQFRYQIQLEKQLLLINNLVQLSIIKCPKIQSVFLKFVKYPIWNMNDFNLPLSFKVRMACQIIARSIIFFKVILQETFKFNKPENPFQNYDFTNNNMKKICLITFYLFLINLFVYVFSCLFTFSQLFIYFYSAMVKYAINRQMSLGKSW